MSCQKHKRRKTLRKHAEMRKVGCETTKFFLMSTRKFVAEETKYFLVQSPLVGRRAKLGLALGSILAEGLLDNKCCECGQVPEWNGKKLVMVLDHINGKPDDNRLLNLRMLCPNCNSQQSTFSGKKNKK